MIKNYLYIFLLLFSFSSAYGQKVKIEGTVRDTAGAPLEMANVIALSAADTSMLSYAFTDDQGRYRITVDQSSGYFLRISYLGFQQQEISIQLKAGEEKVVRNVILKALSVQLQEAEVVENIPIMISGDTISYQADAFTTGRERKLEDVLSELPGFEVDDNGEVKVQGKKVEKVMVEGRDFFDGDTKLATKNIPADAVDKVQVLRNYNEVTPMQGLDNEDRIALNIKLKEGKKNIVFGDISAEGGLDERYLVHPNIFFYSPKISINFIGDVNNIGQPAFTSQDYFRFSGGFKNLTSRGGTNFQFGGDNLGLTTQNNQAREITSRFGAANFSFNPSKKWTVNGFFIGNQSQTLTSSLTSRQYLVDTLNFTETLTTDGVQENTSGIFKFNTTYTPSKKVHVGYKLFSKISEREDVNSQLSTSNLSIVNLENDIETSTNQTPYEIKQNLDAYYDINDHNLVSLEVQHLYDYKDPDYLQRTTIPPFFTVIPLQDTMANAFRLNQLKEITTNKLDATLNHYLIFNNTNHINFTLGGSYTQQQYTSSINEILADDQVVVLGGDSLNNDVDFRLSDIYAAVHYRWKVGKFELNPGLNYHIYSISAEQPTVSINDNLQFLLPDFLIRYNIKKSERLQLDYKMQAQFTDVNNVINGYVIASYNSLFRGNPQIQNGLSHNINLTYYNINLYNFSNLFAGANYSRRVDDITQVTRFQGLDRINSPINVDGINEILTGFGGYEKRFGKLKAQAGATLNLTKINNLINETENQSTTFTQGYRASLGTNFKKAPNVEVAYNVLINKYEGAQVSNTFTTHSPSINVNAVFLKSFTFKADYAYNFYKSPGGLGNTEFDFLNASLYYRKTEKSNWEFTLRGLNLLSTGVNRQDAFNDFFISTTRNDILPRYIMLGVKYNI
jgi:hypothetical protein